MFPEKPSRPKRSGIDTEEERAWVGFYRRVRSDGALAAEVLAQLESDIEMKRKHLALFLSCKQTSRREKARQARHKRIGSFVRWSAYVLFVMPWVSMRNLGRNGRDIAIEILPETGRPSAQAARTLKRAAALPSSSLGVPPSRSRKVQPDVPASAVAGAEKAASACS
jgi:hypothetical protein